MPRPVKRCWIITSRLLLNPWSRVRFLLFRNLRLLPNLLLLLFQKRPRSLHLLRMSFPWKNRHLWQNLNLSLSLLSNLSLLRSLR